MPLLDEWFAPPPRACPCGGRSDLAAQSCNGADERISWLATEPILRILPGLAGPWLNAGGRRW